jgi:hypothetical protein
MRAGKQAARRRSSSLQTRRKTELTAAHREWGNQEDYLE